MAHAVLQQIKALDSEFRNGATCTAPEALGPDTQIQAVIAQKQSLFLDQENKRRRYGLLVISVAPENMYHGIEDTRKLEGGVPSTLLPAKTQSGQSWSSLQAASMPLARGSKS